MIEFQLEAAIKTNKLQFLIFLMFFLSLFPHKGNSSIKNRAFTDTNDASFDSSYSAYLQETKQLAKAAQPTLNLSQSLSNIVDVSALSLAKDKYFEKPSMVSVDSFQQYKLLKFLVFMHNIRLFKSIIHLLRIAFNLTYSSWISPSLIRIAESHIRALCNNLSIWCLACNSVRTDLSIEYPEKERE